MIFIGNSLGEVSALNTLNNQTLFSLSKKDINAITKLMISPFDKNQLFVGSTNGTLSIFDFGDKLLGKSTESTDRHATLHANKLTSMTCSSIYKNFLVTGGLDQRLHCGFKLHSTRLVETVDAID